MQVIQVRGESEPLDGPFDVFVDVGSRVIRLAHLFGFEIGLDEGPRQGESERSTRDVFHTRRGWNGYGWMIENTNLDPAFRGDEDLVPTARLSDKVAEQLFVVSGSVHYGRVPEDASELDGFGEGLLAVLVLGRSITHGETHGTVVENAGGGGGGIVCARCTDQQPGQPCDACWCVGVSRTYPKPGTGT